MEERKLAKLSGKVPCGKAVFVEYSQMILPIQEKVDNNRADFQNGQPERVFEIAGIEKQESNIQKERTLHRLNFSFFKSH